MSPAHSTKNDHAASPERRESGIRMRAARDRRGATPSDPGDDVLRRSSRARGGHNDEGAGADG